MGKYTEKDRKARQRNKDVVAELKKAGCQVCGEMRTPCLDLHHCRDKEHSINLLVQKGRSLTALREELSKCIVVCANCHRMIHSTAAPSHNQRR